jgi:cytochrome P450
MLHVYPLLPLSSRPTFHKLKKTQRGCQHARLAANTNCVHAPKQTVISMSNWFMHRDPTAFPDPDRFDPERWLDSDPSAVRLRERYLVPFSRGSRMCIGQALAMCELYVTIGTLFRRFGDLEGPTEFGPEDLLFEDYLSLFHPVGSRKFTVMRSGKDV